MFGLAPSEIRTLAFDIAEELKADHQFKGAMAGKKWYYSFMQRNPDLSLRKPELTSMVRIKGFSRKRVEKFFDQLEAIVTRYDLGGEQVYNVDETDV